MSELPRFVVATTTMARMFEVAAEMQRRGILERLFTGYPFEKLAQRGLSKELTDCYPAPVLLGMGLNKVFRGRKWKQATEPYPKLLFDRRTAKRLPKADVLFATSSMCLATGREAKKKGMLWLCDRPSTHIVYQNDMMREEYALQGMQWPGISQIVVDRELKEYEESDYVVVRSSFAAKTFVDKGFPADKIWRISHGVDMSRFKPTGEPSDEFFEVLYVGQLSHRKGIRYVLDSFKALDVPNKRLTLVGSPSIETDAMVEKAKQDGCVRVTGAVPQGKLPAIMSQSHVMILPSMEEGLALVLSQALACGCPVIGTPHTGIEDLIEDGDGGFIIPARDTEILTARMQKLADQPDFRREMAAKALSRVTSLGGWEAYVDDLVGLCQRARRS